MNTTPNLWLKSRFKEWFGIGETTYNKWKSQYRLSPYTDAFTGLGQKEPMVNMELFQRFVIGKTSWKGVRNDNDYIRSLLWRERRTVRKAG